MIDSLLDKMELLFVILIIVGSMVIFGGCANTHYKAFYENGNVQADYTREGFIKWSDGDGKVVNMPLSNPSLIKAR